MDAGHGADDSGIMSNSSEPLSSPPGSPDLLVAPAGLPQHSGSITNSLRNGHSGVSGSDLRSATSAPTTSQQNGSSEKPPPKKPGRKKKELTAEEIAAKANQEPKKPGRKPRVAKDANAAPAPAPAPRKRIKVEAPEPTNTTSATGNSNLSVPVSQPSPSRQPTKISDLVSPTNAPQTYQARAVGGPGTPTHRPASSGQMFDPIRGSVIEPPPASPTPLIQNQASASPSIKSLIDPQPQTAMNTSSASRVSISELSGNPAAKPKSPYTAPSSNLAVSSTATPQHRPEESKSKSTGGPGRRVDSGTQSGPPSGAPTPPKTQRLREPPPLPSGSGLLSGTPFGLTAGASNGTKPSKGTNIWLTFALKGKENVTINFSHEIESKYGAAALNPRLAERKERRRLAELAGAELERSLGLNGEGDDMSLDLNSEAESGNDGSDAVMKDAPKSEPEVKKRKRRAEDYDRNDDFIDDAELVLEEQALMAKDGFFVYSGPLIQEGERPAIERADGTMVTRGRGRGRGRGSRGGATGESGRGSRGGRGRGTGTVRKPRVTKADRAAREQEKLARENQGRELATGGATTGSSVFVGGPSTAQEV